MPTILDIKKTKTNDKERKVMNNRLLKKLEKYKNSLTKLNLVGILLLVQKTEKIFIQKHNKKLLTCY